MINANKHVRTRAQESSAAIERLYITMRHLFNRGFYKPMGVSGETLKDTLLVLRPEIYGSVAEEKTELSGLQYVLDRLPEGIEECRFINLTAEEGYRESHFKPIIPPKRRRNCYRIDAEQMNIEITRGRSDIYDVLTHLTFLFVESQKICDKVLVNEHGETTRDWVKLEAAIKKGKKLTLEEREVTISHVAQILGRTFDEVRDAYEAFSTKKNPERFLKVIYWMGKLSLEENVTHNKRSITFSPLLRERIGHHLYGELWANNIKAFLKRENLLDRPLHIISANMHSVMNSLFAASALQREFKDVPAMKLYEKLSVDEDHTLRAKVEKLAKQQGMTFIKDLSGTNIDVQIFDTAKFTNNKASYSPENIQEAPVILVMDYAFGEQAYETIDELLKPYRLENHNPLYLRLDSISIMGKAGILEGGKGDIMIPSAHIFEGTADNYPFENELCKEDFNGHGPKVYEGTMITVLGTSLQNKDILKFFYDSTWNVIGLEMEGAHYQKAIQAASKIRESVSKEVKVRYAYYASDNPLETGSTLASGGLGTTGVVPTYLITDKILKQIFNK